jgi:acyl-[acyl-carrier-protein]-phospholipid O-acyltransferase/long-chain-fatty-acid--[acyl-carrier-protein] ligase
LRRCESRDFQTLDVVIVGAERLPPLWVPTPDSFRQVVALPLLGTGKLDLARVQAMALAEFGQQEPHR